MEEIEFKLLPENCPHKWGVFYRTDYMNHIVRCAWCGKEQHYDEHGNQIDY